MTTYPNSPGYKTVDPETSLQAAQAIKGRAANLREKCHQALKGAAMTADEVAELLGESVLAVRPRIAELHAQGLIYDTGTRRTNASGRPAVVWKPGGTLKQQELI